MTERDALAKALIDHFGDSNRATLTAREAGRQAANVVRAPLASDAKPASEPAIKPLDWCEILTHSGEALSASYGDWGRRIYLRSAPFKGRAEWIEREKAKAQAEFDSYIRAALAPATEGRKS